jgi:hypothetical protein
MAKGKKQDVHARGNRPAQELSEQDLDQVAGGRKADGSQESYLVVTMEDCLVTSYGGSGK